MGELTDRGFWQAYPRDESARPGDSIFHRLLWGLLPHEAGLTYLELGCAPGHNLAYFARRYGYSVTGLDYAGLELTRSVLARLGIHDARLIYADFTTYESEERYDVVASFGLIEHFDDPAWAVARQAAFVKPGGYLLIVMPNLRYGNHLLYRVAMPALLRAHNLAAMDLRVLQTALGDGFELLACRYVFTCALFFDAANPVVASRPWLRSAVAALRWPLERLALDDRPSRVFSPYILVAARRRAAADAGL
jgi:SAM-dependent methyltransferase